MNKSEENLNLQEEETGKTLKESGIEAGSEFVLPEGQELPTMPEAPETPEVPMMSPEEKARMDETVKAYEKQVKAQRAEAHFRRLIGTRKVMKGRKKGRRKRV